MTIGRLRMHIAITHSGECLDREKEQIFGMIGPDIGDGVFPKSIKKSKETIDGEKKCCGNNFQITPETNTDPNYNKTYFSSNLMHLGDGDTEQGCRCMTQKDIDFLSSRGGNRQSYD